VLDLVELAQQRRVGHAERIASARHAAVLRNDEHGVKVGPGELRPTAGDPWARAAGAPVSFHFCKAKFYFLNFTLHP